MRTLLLFLLLTAACAKGDRAAELPPSACHQEHFEGSAFTVCDPGAGKLRLFAAGPDQQPLRSFDDVARQVNPDRIAFGMNAGMFDGDGRPVGLAVVAGVQVHRLNLRNGGGNFHLKPNGVFMVMKDGLAAVVTTEHYAETHPKPAYASQSGPMLVINGRLHPAFDMDGSSRLPRNGVGVTANGHALLAVSDDAVSFGKFARFFRDRLHTPNALYFDGAVSSLWDPAAGRQDSHSELGPIIVALKPAASKPGRAGLSKP